MLQRGVNSLAIGKVEELKIKLDMFIFGNQSIQTLKAVEIKVMFSNIG